MRSFHFCQSTFQYFFNDALCDYWFLFVFTIWLLFWQIISVSIDFLVVVSPKATLTRLQFTGNNQQIKHIVYSWQDLSQWPSKPMYLDNKREWWRQSVEKSMCKFPYALSILKINAEHTLSLTNSNVCMIHLPREADRNLVPMVFIRTGYIGTCCLEHTKIPGSQKESRCST